MESNWRKAWIEFGDVLPTNTVACLPGGANEGWLIGRFSPWTLTKRAKTITDTYANADFLTLGSYEAAYAFLELLYGPEY